MQVSRRTDPLSSKQAEKEINGNGLRNRQQEVVFQAVRKYPNHTSKELCAITGINRYVLGRRLPEIEELWDVKRGPMRKCNIGNRLALTWELV
ncbi:hypothetical protein LCGC14_1069070 [marine sediment metagenome]|uniref:Uncharacterized protein n=1 Tax=marine sediment metagenome TaxID=412755 RepID=A0A0F9MNM7_9ZZZZ|nr:winged helix-turn-helix domain-containing protein [Pricia sp.]